MDEIKTADSRLYEIWLSLAFGAGSDKPNQILSYFETAEDFYKLGAEDMLKLGFLNHKEIANLKGTGLARAQKVIDDCRKTKIEFVTFSEPLYPQRLKLIYGPPAVLYYTGDISGLDDEVSIAVVGTRKSNDYTIEVTKWLCEALARAGAVVISGCAVGIDAMAHFGALKGKGRTIAVLGCGIDVNYPAENNLLKQEILKRGGALISELPPKTNTNSKYFPIRNRLIAGLSLGVLITHAPSRSGSLITAEHALEQGKEVYCVPPYSIMDLNCMGVMKYIRDGSTVVACAEDILMDFYVAYADKLEKSKIIGDYINQKKMESRPQKIKTVKKVEQESSIQLSEEEIASKTTEQKEKFQKATASFDETQIKVYNILDLTPKFIDEISTDCGLNVGVVLSVLTEFEILGIASSFGGRRYSLSQEK